MGAQAGLGAIRHWIGATSGRVGGYERFDKISSLRGFDQRRGWDSHALYDHAAAPDLDDLDEAIGLDVGAVGGDVEEQFAEAGLADGLEDGARPAGLAEEEGERGVGVEG